MKRLLTLLILSIVSILSYSQSDKYKIYPKDEYKKDKLLVLFLDKLNTCIENKDTSTLFKLFNEDIVSSYGGGSYGISGFIDYWRLNDTGKTELWDSFKDVLKYGGVFDNDNGNKIFTIPYYNSNKLFPDIGKKEVSPFSIMICVEPQTAVRNSPDLNSKIRGYLDYDIVILNDGLNDTYSKIHKDPKWVYACTVDNKLFGWIQIEKLESFANRRLILELKNGEWKVLSFAPFD
jgi:hypothetical protein